MFSQDRNQLRQVFFATWQKMQTRQALIPLEQAIAQVVAQHPEYHPLLDNSANLERDYSPALGQSNPFLHMALHLSLNEQLSTDRPPGIVALVAQLRLRFPDPHEVEHEMMDCLGDALWRAQREQRLPDEAAYLACIRKKLGVEK